MPFNSAITVMGKGAAYCVLERLGDIKLASGEPWLPRNVLNIHGPKSLPIQSEMTGGS
jgi:hypothetical protein